MTKLRIIAAAALFLAALAVQGTAARADGTINTVQPLSFGSFMLLNNNAAHTVTVTAQGVTTYSPQIVPTVTAVNGIYDLQGFNASADLSVMIDPVSISLSCTCSTRVFTLDNFDVQPAIPHTDPAGNATIKLGARLQTDGTLAPYGQGAYSGLLTVIVNN